MKLTTFLITSILVALACFAGKAQNIAQAENPRLSYSLKSPKQIDASVADTLLNPGSLMTATDTVIMSLRFDIPDTTVISKIHVKLGSTDGGSDLLNMDYLFDATAQTNGLLYIRKGFRIKLGLGEHLHHPVIYCDLWLEDATGGLSPVTKCQID